jgi:hypothetical protein
VRPEHAGLMLGVLPLQQERNRRVAAGLAPGPVEEIDGYFVAKLQDPDGNPVVMASMSRM